MIETKKELKLNDLLTIRKKMTVKQVQEELVNSEQGIDMEILVPVSNIENIGDPNLIQNTYNELNSYIQENGLIPITTGYNVNVKDTSMVASVDELEVGIYIGVNPNRL